jgi:hypothetical protein
MFKTALTKMAEFAKTNPASFLRYTAAFNFSVGSIGLIIGLIQNDKIPEKEKRFMITQEAIEGMLDLGIFLVLATGFAAFGKALVKKGMVLPSIAKSSENGKVVHYTKKELIPLIKEYFKNPMALSEKVYVPLHKFVHSSVIASDLIGTILAFNITTPIVRNWLASKISKKWEAKIDQTQTYSPILPSLKFNGELKVNQQNPFASFEKRMQPAAMPVFKGTGGMRI